MALKSQFGSLYRSIMVVLGMGAVFGCAPETVIIKKHHTFLPSTIQTIAVAPWIDEDLSSLQAFGLVRNSHVPARSNTSLGVEEATEMVSHMIYTRLRRRSRLQVIAPDVVRETLPSLSRATTNRQFRKLAQDLGQDLSLDAVLGVHARVYRERTSKLGGTPAAVGFDVWLVNAHDGTVLWVGDYFEEQKPLIEDLQGFVERGGTFVTAEELARSGVRRVLHRLPIGGP